MDKNNIKILEERSKRYLQKNEQEAIKTEELVAVFNIANELYGFNINQIDEVFQLTNITRLPGCPKFILGITNIKGKILPVIDLRPFFELKNKGLSDLNKILLISNNEIEVGILADSIKDIQRINMNQLEPPLPVFSDKRKIYTLGISNGVIMLDANQILNDPQLIIDNH